VGVYGGVCVVCVWMCVGVYGVCGVCEWNLAHTSILD